MKRMHLSQFVELKHKIKENQQKLFLQLNSLIKSQYKLDPQEDLSLFNGRMDFLENRHKMFAY